MAFVDWKKCLSEPKQMLRLIALILCACLAAFQLSQCFHKIVRPPVYTHNSFEFNTSLRYPALTVCRNPPYKTHLFQKYGLKGTFLTSNTLDESFFEKYDLDEFFLDITYNMVEVLPLVALNGKSENVVVEEFLSYRFGRCFHMTPVNETSPWKEIGYNLIFRHSETVRRYDAVGTSLTGFIVNSHDRKESFTTDFNRINSFSDQIYIEPAEEIKFNMRVQEFKQLPNVESSYCNDQENYSRSKCMEECFYKKLTEKAGCSVPWMENVNLPRCKNRKDTLELTEFIFSEKPHPLEEACNCPDPCHIVMYSAYVNGRKDNRATTQSLGAVGIQISNNLVMTMVEVYGYDWNLFLADLGGSLGFLLGLSVIGLIGSAEHFFKLIWTKKPKTDDEQPVIEENNSKKTPNFLVDQQISSDSFDICKNNFIKEATKFTDYPSVCENKSMEKF